MKWFRDMFSNHAKLRDDPLYREIFADCMMPSLWILVAIFILYFGGIITWVILNWDKLK